MIDVDVRRSAARNLGLGENTEYRVVAVAGLRTANGRQRFDVPTGQSGTAFHWISPSPGICVSVVPSTATGTCAGTLPLCAGIGPAVRFTDLPSSFREAVRSLRFTASGSRRDPGPRVVRFDELGALILLARMGDVGKFSNPDLDGVVRARGAIDWAYPTMVSVGEGESLRDSARSLYLHHSTLTDRVAVLEDLLGYTLRTAGGRHRLSIALAIDRLQRNADLCQDEYWATG